MAEIQPRIRGPKFHLQLETPEQESTGPWVRPQRIRWGEQMTEPLPANMYLTIPFISGKTNLDYGGGTASGVTDYLATLGVRNLVYDPFARTKTHNKHVLQEIRRIYGVDTVTCCNVLNSVTEPEVRLAIIRNCYRVLKPKGTAYFYQRRRNIQRPYPVDLSVEEWAAILRDYFPFVHIDHDYCVARKILYKNFDC